MPFTAIVNGELTTPFEVDSTTGGICPACHKPLLIRDSHQRDGHFVAKHFWHPTTPPDGCDGGETGESTQHKQMKSIAASKASTEFPDATVTLEHQLGKRRADVLIEFQDHHERFGKGIAIEVQYKHHDKDTEAVKTDFRDQEYSVLWLNETHFNTHNADFSKGDLSTWWPTQIPTNDDWSGFHDIIHWLQQPLSPPVEMNVPFPAELFSPEVSDDWALGFFKTHQHEYGWSSIFSAPLYEGSGTTSRIGISVNAMRQPRVFIRKHQNGQTTTEEDPNLCHRLDDLRRINSILDSWDIDQKKRWAEDAPLRSGDWVPIEEVTTATSTLKLLCKVQTGHPTLVIEDKYDDFVSARVDPEIAVKSITNLINVQREIQHLRRRDDTDRILLK